jgi:hypothetical protein
MELETGGVKKRRINSEIDEESGAPDLNSLRVLEFYSGIGGMHVALERFLADEASITTQEVLSSNTSDNNHSISQNTKKREGKVLMSFDINENANAVYQLNFSSPVQRVSYYLLIIKLNKNKVTIENITIKQLDKFQSNVWLMVSLFFILNASNTR